MSTLSRLLDHHTTWVRQTCAADPAGTISIQRLIDGAGTAALDAPSGTLFGVLDGGWPCAAYWVGTSVIPLKDSVSGTDAVAQLLNRRGRRQCSLLGYREPVLDIYRRLQWGPPRGVRPHQPLMVAVEPPVVEPLPVRVATIDEVDEVYAASVAMFTEEVGFSPVGSNPSGYRSRVAALIRAGHTFVATRTQVEETAPARTTSAKDDIVFKADVGVLSSGAAQIQGVWVRPDMRGRGIAGRAMVAVVARVRELVPVVSLYANAFNTAAPKAYERAGFRQVGEFATVMY